MADYDKIVREIIKRNLGEARFEEICQRFGLTAADRELLDELMAQLKPDYTLEDIVALCEDYEARPNIGPVMRAWEVIAWEAAQTSHLRRQHRDN